MTRPVLYFVRHGETDWNFERRLQGQRDIPLNALGRRQATHCGELLGELFAREGRTPDDLVYVSSPLGRARETMELMRGRLGLNPESYTTDARLMEMSFGRWEGFTFSELQSREAPALAERERDKWGFVVPGGESYAQLLERVRNWFETLECDTVVAAHGGVCRTLFAHLGIAGPQAASAGNVEQGVIYVFADGEAVRHG